METRENVEVQSEEMEFDSEFLMSEDFVHARVI